MSETMEKPISKMTAAEIKEHLKRTEKAEKAEKARKEREYEKRKSDFVMDTCRTFKQLHNRLKDFKSEILLEGNSLHKDMYAIFDREEKDLNQFSLQSEDGKFKLTLDRAERQKLGEKAEVAINQIRQILKEKFEGRNKTMYAIIDDILMKRNTGEYDERLVSKLRKHEEAIDDPRFSEALDILADSYFTEGTSLYVRAYERENPDASWRDITLQFSKL